jgi:hypothetical protein
VVQKPNISSHLSATTAQDAASVHNVFDALPARQEAVISAEDTRRMLRDPANIRQVFVLHEILSPPRSTWSGRRAAR